MLLKVLFYLFALLLIYSAIRVISAKNPMVAVLHLVLAFATTSGLWFIIEAEFLALALIIIYCGAVMVFFLFTVMMIDIPYATVRDGFTRFMPIGVLVALVIIVEMALILTGEHSLFIERLPEGFTALTANGSTNSAHGHAFDLGELLYTEYLYAFEVIALILLVALIAAICLTRRSGPLTRKDVNVSWQIKVDPTDRVRLVSMESATMASYEKESDDEEKSSEAKEEQ